MSPIIRVFAIVLSIIAITGFVSAQPSRAASAALPFVELPSSADVETIAVFPASAEKSFTVGEPVEIVFGFTNKGDKPFNVTLISGSLRYPPDWKMYIQNFTKQAVGVLVFPDEQFTFSYLFRPDAMLEPREFALAAQVFYSDNENRNFSTYFYNDTITLLEVNEGFDIQLLFTYVGILAVFILVAFFAYTAVAKAAKKSGVGRRNRVVETGTKTPGADDEWLEGTFADAKFTGKNKPQSPKSPRTDKKPKSS